MSLLQESQHFQLNRVTNQYAPFKSLPLYSKPSDTFTFTLYQTAKAITTST